MKEQYQLQLQILMEETGCERSEAELAFSLSGNNIEKAITTIGFLSKFITVFKIKLIFTKETIYSLIDMAINSKTLEILRFNIVFSHNPSVYEIPANMDWFSFEKAIFSARLDAGTMENYTREIEKNLKSYVQQAVKEFSSISNDRIKKIIKTFFSYTEVSIEIINENLNLTQFKKLPDYNVKQNSDFFTGYDLGFVKLDVKILEDSKGEFVRKISEGDTVLSIITDKRDIAHYLVHLIGGIKDGSMMPIPATVKKIFYKNNNYEIHLYYAPSIMGLAKTKNNIKLKVLGAKSQLWWEKILPW